MRQHAERVGNTSPMLPSSNTCCMNSLVSNRSSPICCSLRRKTLDVTMMPSGRVSFRELGSWGAASRRQGTCRHADSEFHDCRRSTMLRLCSLHVEPTRRPAMVRCAEDYVLSKCARVRVTPNPTCHQTASQQSHSARRSCVSPRHPTASDNEVAASLPDEAMPRCCIAGNCALPPHLTVTSNLT